jgi:Rps23 Pro-64 3,4-dihydroxylase Tpa1-like proline 4-hydroxylase
MSYLTVDAETLTCDIENAAETGATLAQTYRSAAPFPHIVLDDFVSSTALQPLLTEWPDAGSKSHFNRSQERLKFQWERAELKSPYIRAFLAEMNSPGVIRFLEEMTGIRKLVPDPYFRGGGLHETKAGGHLSVHADFNIHPELDLVRRINLLIYLNEEWQDDFGGKLELWDAEMARCVEEIAPVFGRAVIFNTDAESFHGQPKPLTCPSDRSRKSVALYYYTAAEHGIKNIRRRTTQFKPRPATDDRRDTLVARQEILEDWLPPVLLRQMTRAAHRARRMLNRGGH